MSSYILSAWFDWALVNQPSCGFFEREKDRNEYAFEFRIRVSRKALGKGKETELSRMTHVLRASSLPLSSRIQRLRTKRSNTVQAIVPLITAAKGTVSDKRVTFC